MTTPPINELAVQLIDSTFSKENAFEVIKALLDHKIAFHQRKRFSDDIRFSEDRSREASRIKALKEERERVKAFFESMDSNAPLSVSALVHIVESEEQASRRTA